jgi:hypothetical protein
MTKEQTGEEKEKDVEEEPRGDKREARPDRHPHLSRLMDCIS